MLHSKRRWRWKVSGFTSQYIFCARGSKQRLPHPAAVSMTALAMKIVYIVNAEHLLTGVRPSHSARIKRGEPRRSRKIRRYLDRPLLRPLLCLVLCPPLVSMALRSPEAMPACTSPSSMEGHGMRTHGYKTSTFVEHPYAASYGGTSIHTCYAS
jgi:hypothetical protein